MSAFAEYAGAVPGLPPASYADALASLPPAASVDASVGALSVLRQLSAAGVAAPEELDLDAPPEAPKPGLFGRLRAAVRSSDDAAESAGEA